MTDDIPACDITGEPVDECDHISVLDYDERDAADDRHQQEQDERSER